MIIGVSGKIGSGKDTIGKIIRLLSLGNHIDDIPSIIKNNENFPVPYPEKGYMDWEIKKYADTLKDIICLLINCTREDLENQEFKDTPLGKEWKRWYWYYNCRVSKYFNDQKQAELYFDRLDLNDKSSLSIAMSLASLKVEILTPRLLLQLMGTECGRRIIHPNLWVNALMSRYVYTERINKSHLIYPNWIITDVRFPNELKAIKDKGGFVIRITRNKPVLDNERKRIQSDKAYSNISTVQHESETALDLYPFKIRIANNDSLEELVEKVRLVLIEKNIL